MKIHPEMKALECSQHYSHYRSMEIFFRHSSAANSIDPCSILLNFKPIQAFIAVVVTCKNVKDRIINVGARALTTLYINFSNAQGQLSQ